MGMVGFEALAAADAIELRAMIEEHLRAHRLAGRRARAGGLGGAAGEGAFVKVMPHDYKRVLRELAEQEALAASGRERRRGGPPAVGASGRAGLMGKLGGFLQIERHGIPSGTRSSARTTTASSCSRGRWRSCASRAPAAWTAACRSATTAARWGT